MKLKSNELSKAVRLALVLSAGAMVAVPNYGYAQGDAEKLETIEVVGSRIKRADAEDSLPVTVISREDIEQSGKMTVSDLLRSQTFNSFGSFRPESGSSAQGVAQINLRGLGSARTLVLIDGRRAPTSPFAGQGADLNTIPLAAVERIEILSDGASAVYGSDAIGGVVNVVLRKDFDGIQGTFGLSNPTLTGGESEEASVIFGTSSDSGSLMAGASYSNTGIFFTKDRPWGENRGISSYGNNYQFLDEDGNPVSSFTAIPSACTAENFYLTSTGTCSFDFNVFATDDTEQRLNSAFARAEYHINDNWTSYMSSNVSRARSFGRYAPTPGELFIPSGSPNNPFDQDILVRHRYAASGPRDNTVETTAYDTMLGLTGTLGRFSVDFGGRRNEVKGYELGKNYIVTPIAEQYAADGTYNIYDPFTNDADVLNAMKATINRDTKWQTDEFYAVANTDLVDMTGGMASIAFGAEWRREQYADLYDSLQEAGVIAGSAGNSAEGGRTVRSAFVEALFPVLEKVEVTVAGRYDSYSDYGSDFSPKVSVRYQPLEDLVLRASYGEGFRAPTLDILTAKPAFSADDVVDIPTCNAFGTVDCLDPDGDITTVQVDTYRLSNPNLESENSKQYSLGFAWDATSWLNASLDYYSIEVENQINFFSAQDLVDLEELGFAAPAGLGVYRNPDQSIDYVNAGYGNLGKLETSGLDLNIHANFDFDNYGTLSNNLQVAWTNKYEETQADGSIYDYVDEVAQPKYRVQMQNLWAWHDFTVGWNINLIDNQQDPDGGNYVPTWVTHDLQGTWSAPWNGKFTLGVTNVENDLPALVSVDGRVYNRALYDAYGRVPYFRYTQTF